MPHKTRRAIHVAAALVLYYTGALRLLAWLRRRLTREPILYVLAFHRILSVEEQPLSNSLPGMILNESVFSALLEYLQRKFHFVSLDRILGNVAGTRNSARPMCLVTFDDGWGDTYRRAAPILQRLKVPAVLFVPTSMLGSQSGFWVERFAAACKSRETVNRVSDRVGGGGSGGRIGAETEAIIESLKRMPAASRDAILSDVLSSGNGVGIDAMMTWDQVTRVSASGFEIGSHTITHPLLTFEDEATQAWELESSREQLQERLGADVRAFAYPNGNWNSKVRESVIRAGYLCAFTTKSGCYANGGDLYSIPRFLLHQGNVTGFRGQFSRAMANLTLAGWA